MVALNGCILSSDKKASHTEVLAAVTTMCAARAVLTNHVFESKSSEPERAQEAAQMFRTYDDQLSKFLRISATDSNDQRLLDQLRAGYKEIRALTPLDNNPVQRRRALSDQISAHITAAGDEFSCLVD